MSARASTAATSSATETSGSPLLEAGVLPSASRKPSAPQSLTSNVQQRLERSKSSKVETPRPDPCPTVIDTLSAVFVTTRFSWSAGSSICIPRSCAGRGRCRRQRQAASTPAEFCADMGGAASTARRCCRHSGRCQGGRPRKLAFRRRQGCDTSAGRAAPVSVPGCS